MRSVVVQSYLLSWKLTFVFPSSRSGKDSTRLSSPFHRSPRRSSEDGDRRFSTACGSSGSLGDVGYCNARRLSSFILCFDHAFVVSFPHALSLAPLAFSLPDRAKWHLRRDTSSPTPTAPRLLLAGLLDLLGPRLSTAR